ncbi:unnamed protein product [Jaminaea pallidilutea]
MGQSDEGGSGVFDDRNPSTSTTPALPKYPGSRLGTSSSVAAGAGHHQQDSSGGSSSSSSSRPSPGPLAIPSKARISSSQSHATASLAPQSPADVATAMPVKSSGSQTPEEPFFTPRGGSPFFSSSSISAKPDSKAVAATTATTATTAAAAAAAPAPPPPTGGAVAESPDSMSSGSSSAPKAASASRTGRGSPLDRVTGVASTADGDVAGEGDKVGLEPYETVIDTRSSQVSSPAPFSELDIASVASSSSSTLETSSLATVTPCPARQTSDPLIQADATPIVKGQGLDTAGRSIPSTGGSSAASTVNPSLPAASYDPQNQAAPLSPAWQANFHQTLVQSGLTEAAAAAEQELRAFEARQRSGTGASSVEEAAPKSDASHAPSAASTAESPSPESSAMTARQQSASSEISRTPSTSTTGSLTTQSHSSSETTPSSVPSEHELYDGAGSAESAEAKTAGPDSSGSTPNSMSRERTVEGRLRRYHSLLELVETEQTYAQDLASLVHVYMEALPLQSYFEDHPARLETVVRNGPELAALHNEIATDLEQILEDHSVSASSPGSAAEKAFNENVDAAVLQVAKYLVDIGDRLMLYREYCPRHPEAMSVLKEAEKRHNGEDFLAFERMCSNVLRNRPMSSRNSSTTDLKALRSGSSTPGGPLSSTTSLSTAKLSQQGGAFTPLASSTPLSAENVAAFESWAAAAASSAQRQSGRLGFADLLIKPVQRLCLYPLIINTLLKYTSPDEASHEPLTAAFAAMKRAADETDVAGQKRQHFLVAELAASRIEPVANLNSTTVSSFGNIELSGTLDVMYHHPTLAPLLAPLRFHFLGVFLYAQGLLIVRVRKTERYEPIYWFPLDRTEMSSAEEHEGLFPHALHLTVNGEHHFEIAASSSRERALWVEKISMASAAVTSQKSAATPFPCSLPMLDNLGTRKSRDADAVFNEPKTQRHQSSGHQHQRRSSVGSTNAPAPKGDGLRDFLAHQRDLPSSSDIIVRYGSLAQRAVADRGMVLSDAVLAARAITQRDGSFMPGGSITKSAASAPAASGSMSMTPMSVPGLTAWPAGSTSSTTTSLGAAVGAAMGLARVAKRSSKPGVNSNVVEIAAQQHLASEEQRMADEARAEQQLAFQRSLDESYGVNTSESLRSQAQRKRSSMPNRSMTKLSSLAPLTTAVNDGADSSPGQSADQSALDAGNAIQRAASPGSNLLQPLRRRQSGLRDTFANPWSRRSRTQSADLDSLRKEAQAVGSQPNSPTVGSFEADLATLSRTASPSGMAPEESVVQEQQQQQQQQARLDAAFSAQKSRPSGLKRAITGMTLSKRAQTQSAVATSAAPSVEGLPRKSLSGDVLQGVQAPSPTASQHEPAQPAAATPTSETPGSTGGSSGRRRTSSSFGIMGPPLSSLRRSMSITGRWNSPRSSIDGGTRSASHSRRSSSVTIDALTAVTGGQASGSASRSQTHLASNTADDGAEQYEPAPASPTVGSFSRSATDTNLDVSNKAGRGGVAAFRPKASRMSSTPSSSRLSHLSADMLGLSRLPGGTKSTPSSRDQSRRSSAVSLSGDIGALSALTPVEPIQTKAKPPTTSLSVPSSPVAASASSGSAGKRPSLSAPRRSNRLSALFQHQVGGQNSTFGSYGGGGGLGLAPATQKRDSPNVSPGSSPYCMRPGASSSPSLSAALAGGSSTHLMPSPLAEENENPYHSWSPVGEEGRDVSPATTRTNTTSTVTDTTPPGTVDNHESTGHSAPVSSPPSPLPSTPNPNEQPA